MVESSASASTFVSGLGKGRDAFLSEVAEAALELGERSPEDFLRSFSCGKIMISLASRPMERARIISELTGVHERVANKLSPENAGETLQIAVDEGVTTPKDIVRLFQADDRQRYLNRHELWTFATGGEAWKASANDASAHGRAERFTAYLMDRAIENLLISHEDIVSALGVVKLAGWLPSELLGQIIEASLKKSDKFTEEDLLGAAPPASLVTHVPLDYLWERVIVPLVAQGHDYAPKANAKPAGEADGSWSLRPEPEVAPAAKPDEGEMVGEDEIIETDDEVRASESGATLGVRKAGSAPLPKKAQQR